METTPDEEQPLLISSKSSNSKQPDRWRLISVLSLICAMSLIAVSYNWSQERYSSTIPSLLSQIELAKIGEIPFEKLSDTDIDELFLDFKTRFRKQVIIALKNCVFPLEGFLSLQ